MARRHMITKEAPTKGQTCRFEVEDVRCKCPVEDEDTDSYRVVIEYEPEGYIIERNSLREYLDRFEEETLWAEELAEVLVGDIEQYAKPKWVHVELTQEEKDNVQLTVEDGR